MEQEAPRKLTKADIVGLLLFGALQGALVALGVAIWDKHLYGHWRSPSHLLASFAIFMGFFAVGNLALRKIFPRGLSPVRTAMGARIRLIVFVILMLILFYSLWKTC